MQVRTNTDRNIEGSAEFTAEVESIVLDAVGRFADRITSVEVHVSDENSARGGGVDKRCVMEARVGGLPPIAVTHQAITIELALSGAADKLARSIDSTLGRLRDS